MHGLSTTTIPSNLHKAIERRLDGFSLSLSQDAAKIAKAVLSLSTFYLQQPKDQTPYHQPWAQIASIAYFLPLNTIRLYAVMQHAKALGFFGEIGSALDIGSGLGAVSFAMAQAGVKLSLLECVERSQWAADSHRLLLGLGGGSSAGLCPHEWHVGTASDRNFHMSQVDLVTFSYSLTEFETLPPGLQRAKNVIIVEPGTLTDARALMRHRKTLQQWGFHIWAPCTHQGDCPLLTRSERDWCHDRVAWEQPDWYQAIEEHLPMRNQTLPFAYLLASRREPPPTLKGLSRLVGDRIDEKGRSKQMLCRGAAREFAVWQKRQGPPPDILRGTLLAIAADAKQGGDGVHLLPGQWSVAESPRPN